MNILVIHDRKIAVKDLQGVCLSVSSIFEENTSTSPTFHFEVMDFSHLEFEPYRPQSLGIKKAWLKKVSEDVRRRWSEEIDLVIFEVHEDHWRMESKVWGWNISEVFGGYEIQQCRWDKKNYANSVGTMYHEIMHAMDSFIYRYTGIMIEKLVDVRDWDRAVVHGKEPGWDYIRYKHNSRALRSISPALEQAVAARRSVFNRRMRTQMWTIISLLTQLRELLRRKKRPRSPLHV